MWPFTIKHILERKRIREIFSRYISPEMAARLSANPEQLNLKLEPGRIHFLLLQVRDDIAMNVSSYVSKVVDILV